MGSGSEGNKGINEMFRPVAILQYESQQRKDKELGFTLEALKSALTAIQKVKDAIQLLLSPVSETGDKEAAIKSIYATQKNMFQYPFGFLIASNEGNDTHVLPQCCHFKGSTSKIRRLHLSAFFFSPYSLWQIIFGCGCAALGGKYWMESVNI